MKCRNVVERGLLPASSSDSHQRRCSQCGGSPQVQIPLRVLTRSRIRGGIPSLGDLPKLANKFGDSIRCRQRWRSLGKPVIDSKRRQTASFTERGEYMKLSDMGACLDTS